MQHKKTKANVLLHLYIYSLPLTSQTAERPPTKTYIRDWVTLVLHYH